MERHIPEKLLQGVSLGLVAVGLMECVSVPSNTEGYYNPFTDEVTYLETPTAKIMIHEQVHKTRANEYPEGRIMWGLRYSEDKAFACSEEEIANAISGITDEHPACQ